LFVYRWDSKTEAWQDDAIAFTQGTVTPRRFVNGSLFLLDPDDGLAKVDGDESYRMKPGKVLVKAYVDTKHRIAVQPSILLGEEDFQGQAETDATWGIGFPDAEVIEGNKFDR
jgi:hypothetical protein